MANDLMKTSHNNKLGDGLKNYYQGQSLSAQSMQQLLAQADNAKSAPTRWFERRLAWVASLFVVAMLGQFLYYQQSHQESLTTLVLEEIAMNHNKNLNTEYIESRPSQLRVAMQRLDFSLDLPAGLQQEFQLIGGRYCSIQGGLAAQLKVRSIINDKVATLYVTPLTEKLKQVEQQSATLGDVDIRLWQQQGRFFGLATTRQ